QTRPDPNLTKTFPTRQVSGLTRIGVRQSSLLGKKLYGTGLVRGSGLVSGSGIEKLQKLKANGSGRKVVVRAGLSLVPEKPLGLYDPAFDKDSCGVGFVAELSGIGNRKTVTDAIEMLVRMSHRGACG
ncbi:hypothetical protein M8C21_002408, partial [Ambrosia artemisiifolia]